MNIPQNVATIREEGDLKLYHYTDTAQHPGVSDFWKGVVMDENVVVARSFPWGPTVVTDVLPDDYVYTPMYEATVLRFYRHEGKPMIGTHRQIDISQRDSRVTPSSKRFIDLVKEAIARWDYKQYDYAVPDRGNGYAYTPTTWEELCIHGWCHVFLLVDTSNQITDLIDLSRTHELTNKNGETDIVTFTGPKLLHAMSFVQDTEMDESGMYPMVPYGGQVVMDIPIDDQGYQQYTWLVPHLNVMTSEQAEERLENGGAVVGFSPLFPDQTTKYLSYEYARKLELAGETFNPVYRWHQLMDENIDDATEYINNLPWHLKHMSIFDMQEEHADHLNNIINTLAINVVARFNKKDATMDRRLYNKVSPIIAETVAELRNKYGRDKVNNTVLQREAESLLLEKLLSLSYIDQHAINSTIQRVARDQ